MSRRPAETTSAQVERPPHHVVSIVDLATNPFEVGFAVQIFAAAALWTSSVPYDFRLCSVDRAQVAAAGLFRASLVDDIAIAQEADTLLAPNRVNLDEKPSAAVVTALREAHSRGARLITCWTGAFTLAEAGLLDGRRATTHWRWADAFRRRYPNVFYVPDVLFVDDGDIITGAGGASSIDLGLHVLRQDLGVEVAALVSDELLLAPPRDAVHPQQTAKSLPKIEADSLAPLMEWARGRLDATLSVSELAAFAAVSEATLYRRFRAQVGTTPLAWITNERLAIARLLLERGEPSLDIVARRAGLGTATNLRELIRRTTGMNPSQYRRRFARLGQVAVKQTGVASQS